MRTFGTIRMDEATGSWLIKTEPHVALKLKRVFPKIPGRSFGTIMLKHTPENCVDLLWFCGRYPLEIQGREIMERAAAHRQETLEDLERITGFDYEPRTFDLSSEMEQREYQRVGAELYLRQGFLLCADDVGLGKTALGIMSFAEPGTLPALVVTLTHLPRQWEEEIHRFVPGLRVHILRKASPYDLPEFFGKGPDVIIANYHKLAGWAEHLGGHIQSIIFDECQELRRSASLKYSAARHIAERAAFRLGLSATPIYNCGEELFNVADILSPGCLGSHGEFLQEWCGSSYYAGKAHVNEPKAFGTFLRENFIMIRRTRKEVRRELPDVSKIPYAIDSNTKALDDIADSAAELARIILRRVTADREVRFRAAGEFDMLMRQATGIAKAPYVADFVRLLVESGERVMLYGWHREVYSIWQSKLADLDTVMFTGSETPAAKEKAKQAFIGGEASVMFISLRAGAGMDGLQKACRTVVFGELDWSPGVHEQCIGRVHRDGQEDKVAAYYLVSETGSDPIMAETLGIKREQVEGIRDPSAPLVEKLSRGADDLKKLAEHYLRRAG